MSPRPPLIELQPRCRTQRLAQIELGRLMLLDAPRGAGLLAIRADALSAQGELTEGVLRLDPAQPRFERRRLDDPLLSIDLEYLIEADLASARVRAPASGDLVLSRGAAAAGLWLAAPFGGALLDLATALLRPYAADSAGPPRLALHWHLVERAAHRRILFSHGGVAGEPAPPRAPPEDEEGD